VIELAAHRTQTCFDIPKALAISELGETHRQKLIPTGETLLLVVAVITRYALLELVSRNMLHDLRKNRLAYIHPSLSAIDVAGPGPHSGAFFAQKKFKSKNLKIMVNLLTFRAFPPRD
jgi:hypothetical protein